VFWTARGLPRDRHAPHHADEKVLEYDLAPFGVVGLETAIPVTYDLLSAAASSHCGCSSHFGRRPGTAVPPSGGSLKVGSPADITVLDLDARATVNPDRFRSLSRNTPFAGQRLKGWPPPRSWWQGAVRRERK